MKEQTTCKMRDSDGVLINFDIEYITHAGENRETGNGQYILGFDPYKEITKISIGGSGDLTEFLRDEVIEHIEQGL